MSRMAETGSGSSVPLRSSPLAPLPHSPEAARPGPCWPTLRSSRKGPDAPGWGRCCFPTRRIPSALCAGTSPSCGGPSTGVTLDGDPLRLALQPPWRCDAVELVGAGAIPRLDPHNLTGQLLEGLSFADCPVFDSWLADQRYRLENCAQSVLYESSVSAMASGDPRAAAELATLALQRDPFHTDCNAVLVRALVAMGEHRHAREHVTKCGNLYRDELGLPLPPEIRRALSGAAPEADPGMPATVATVRSYLDAGGASLSAGAVDRGLDQLRLAVALAQRTPDRHLLAESLVTLAGAMIHQAGGRGAEVADFLHRALSAEAPPAESPSEGYDGASPTTAAAYRELGYLSVQRGVPDRAAGWLERASAAAAGFPEEQARVLAIQGMLASDTARYGDAVDALTASGKLAREVRNRRQQAFSSALLGRVWLLRGELDLAAKALDHALEWIAAEHWTAFEPFVAGVRGETYLAAGDLEAAAEMIDRSWVMADLAGDHCYMALAAGAEARLFLAHGDLAAAQHWVERGMEPKPWYLWYSARLLDVAAEVAIAARSERAGEVVERLGALASRSGMREFVVRAQSHRAVLGDETAAQAVPWLAKEIDSPALTAFLAARGQL
jgi:tetratricopeptide (TPR) repeat protein